MEDAKRMQLQLDKHAVQIAKLFSKIDDTNAKIQKIFNILNQIRYFIYGGIAYFVASEVGLFNLLKLVAWWEKKDDRIFNKHSTNSIRIYS